MGACKNWSQEQIIGVLKQFAKATQEGRVSTIDLYGS